MTKLCIWERQIFGIVCVVRVWKIRPSMELQEMKKEPNIVVHVKTMKLIVYLVV